MKNEITIIIPQLKKFLDYKQYANDIDGLTQDLEFINQQIENTTALLGSDNKELKNEIRKIRYGFFAEDNTASLFKDISRLLSDTEPELQRKLKEIIDSLTQHFNNKTTQEHRAAIAIIRKALQREVTAIKNFWDLKWCTSVLLSWNAIFPLNSETNIHLEPLRSCEILPTESGHAYNKNELQTYLESQISNKQTSLYHTDQQIISPYELQLYKKNGINIPIEYLNKGLSKDFVLPYYQAPIKLIVTSFILIGATMLLGAFIHILIPFIVFDLIALLTLVNIDKRARLKNLSQLAKPHPTYRSSNDIQAEILIKNIITSYNSLKKNSGRLLIPFYNQSRASAHLLKKLQNKDNTEKSRINKIRAIAKYAQDGDNIGSTLYLAICLNCTFTQIQTFLLRPEIQCHLPNEDIKIERSYMENALPTAIRW